jgi:hypothetical protein
MIEQPLMNGAKMPGGTTDPVSERRTVEVDALTLVDLRLAIKWQVVGIFGDQHLGDGSLGRNATFDQSCRGRSLDNDLLAGPAGILRAAHHQHAELCGHDVELLADVLADPMQVIVAARAGMVGLLSGPAGLA